VWISPTLHARQVRNIAEGLARCDPARAEGYRRNAEEYARKLEELGRRMQDALKNVPNRDIVTFHEAFPYFAREFGLNIVAVVEREPGSEPSARELAETIETVRAKGVKALFAEPQYPAKSADAIALETGAVVHTLDPVATGPISAGAYLDAMDRNLAVLQEALQ
jgi:zinc transport system substrate-binding protein